MSSITIRRCCIGEGRPKVIVPIVERTEAAILQKAAAFSTISADCVEWRADWFADALDADALSRCLRGLRAALGEKLLLVTFRTQAEGGEAALTADQYAAFAQPSVLPAAPTCWTSSSFLPGNACPNGSQPPTPPG